MAAYGVLRWHRIHDDAERIEDVLGNATIRGFNGLQRLAPLLIGRCVGLLA